MVSHSSINGSTFTSQEKEGVSERPRSRSLSRRPRTENAGPSCCCCNAMKIVQEIIFYNQSIRHPLTEQTPPCPCFLSLRHAVLCNNNRKPRERNPVVKHYSMNYSNVQTPTGPCQSTTSSQTHRHLCPSSWKCFPHPVTQTGTHQTLDHNNAWTLQRDRQNGYPQHVLQETTLTRLTPILPCMTTPQCTVHLWTSFASTQAPTRSSNRFQSFSRERKQSISHPQSNSSPRFPDKSFRPSILDDSHAFACLMAVNIHGNTVDTNGTGVEVLELADAAALCPGHRFG